MITVSLTVGSRGEIVSVSAEGHANAGKRGTDIVCAAATVLLRTTLAVMGGSGVDVSASAAARGFLAFRVRSFSEAELPLLVYASRFLEEGLTSLAAEYPENLEVRKMTTD